MGLRQTVELRQLASSESHLCDCDDQGRHISGVMKRPKKGASSLAVKPVNGVQICLALLPFSVSP